MAVEHASAHLCAPERGTKGVLVNARLPYVNGRLDALAEEKPGELLADGERDVGVVEVGASDELVDLDAYVGGDWSYVEW